MPTEEIKNSEHEDEKPCTISEIEQARIDEDNLRRNDYLDFLEHENPIELETRACENRSGFRFHSVPQINPDNTNERTD